MAPFDEPTRPGPRPGDDTTLEMLEALHKKVLWLSTWMIHHANHVRPKRDKMKVGGHQASCASIAQIMTALYFSALRPRDRVAVKPHASPVFHAIQYLFGQQTQQNLERFRAFGGAQSYPSRTKDADDVDISTGSVGLGPAMTVFTSMVQDYVRRHFEEQREREPGRMIAIVGDAEMDEGNMYEALWEGWKHGLRNCWWIIDYNRQSLDAVVPDHLSRLIDRMFRTTGWRVMTLKYGKKMRAAFAKPGGKKLRKWITDCPNDLYSALTFRGGAAWRARLTQDIGDDPDVARLIETYDDDALQDLMTNLAGHCLETLLEAFHEADQDETPTCFIAYTIKGWGLPIAGHKDNHAGILTDDQLGKFRAASGLHEGEEWTPFAGFDDPDAVKAFVGAAPFAAEGRRRLDDQAPPVEVPAIAPPEADVASTQESFGKILYGIAGTRTDFARAVVTTSPDVTQSTNLGGWVNRRGIFARDDRQDTFRNEQIPSAQKWEFNDAGQHFELGIAENNLFIMLAALGLAHSFFGRRLLPVATVYDPFIARGLDALNYACYQDARFMLVATPSGISLAPEGGAHQSVSTPLIGLGQPGLTYFEPAYADELAAVMEWGFRHMQADDGGSVYLRLSTKPVEQPGRKLTKALKTEIVDGGYWAEAPGKRARTAIVYCGAMAPEARAAWEEVRKHDADAGLLAVTSPDRLYEGWQAKAGDSHVAALLRALPAGTRIVTVHDGSPATLTWLGGVVGQPVRSLGVSRFGQCGDLADIYAEYGLDAEAIARAALGN